MKITDFKALIGQMPEPEHSFEIKKTVWDNVDTKQVKSVIDNIFNGKDKIVISRNDLFNACAWDDMQTFIIKTLMWGYPTFGRGKHIKLLLKNNFETLVKLLTSYKNNGINEQELAEFLKIEHLGLSTLSKFLYFLKIKVAGKPSLILDLRIIDIINSGNFEEFETRKIKYGNAKDYLCYLSKMADLADEMNVSGGQLEMFLFVFGKNLKEAERMGDDGFTDDTEESNRYSLYSTYLQLKKNGKSLEEIAKEYGISVDEMNAIIKEFE